MTEEDIANKIEREDDEIGVGIELLLPRDSLLSAGIHIGTRIKTKDIESFIYKVRHDGLFVLDIKKTDERIRLAAKFLSRFSPSRVVVASSRLYGRTPVQTFCELTQATSILGRFPPGLLSNPTHSDYIDADVVVVTDPKADKQAVKEASSIGIPVIALCDTDNDFIDVDLIIPTNNKGRRALATIYWLLARQVLIEKGELPSGGDMPVSIDEFETKIEASEIPEIE
ncbi:MAG: 30S ribosomal protein S2 [Candidatus Bathyarchaeota archaeon]